MSSRSARRPPLRVTALRMAAGAALAQPSARVAAPDDGVPAPVTTRTS